MEEDPESAFAPALLGAILGVALFGAFAAVRHYLPLRKTPLYVTIPVMLAIATSSFAIALVPLDVASTDKSHYSWMVAVSEERLTRLWKVCYWLTFVLTWIVLPGVGEYVISGYQDARDKIAFSFRSNMQYHLMVGCIGLLMALYFFHAAGFEFASFKALVMAGTYAWGLLLACYLMGDGFVTLPRRYLLRATPDIRILNLSREADLAQFRKESNRVQFVKRVAILKQICRLVQPTEYLQDWTRSILEEVTAAEDELVSLQDIDSTSPVRMPGAVPKVDTAKAMRSFHNTKSEIAAAVRSFNNSKQVLKTTETEIRRLKQEIQSLKEVMKDYSEGTGPILLGRFRDPILNGHPLFSYYIATNLNWAVGVILSCFSILMLCSQTVAIFDPSATPVAIITRRFHAHWLFIVLMFHSTISAVSTLPRIRFGWWPTRTLTPGSTALEPAVWFSSQLARLTVPLALNFSSLLPKSVYNEMVFYKFLGAKVDLTPIGGAFARFAPLTVIILAVMAELGGTYSWFRPQAKVRSSSSAERGVALSRTAGDGAGSTEQDREARSGGRPFQLPYADGDDDDGDGAFTSYLNLAPPAIPDLGERGRSNIGVADRMHRFVRTALPPWLGGIRMADSRAIRLEEGVDDE